MQPTGIAGVHHAAEPPIRIGNQVFALPVLAASGTGRTPGNDGPVVQPPQYCQFPDVQAHTAPLRYDLVRPCTTSKPRSYQLLFRRDKGLQAAGTDGTTFSLLLLYRGGIMAAKHPFSSPMCLKDRERSYHPYQTLVNAAFAGTKSGTTSKNRSYKVVPGRT